MRRLPASGQLLIVTLLIMALLVSSIPVLVNLIGRLQKTRQEARNAQDVYEVAHAAFIQVSTLFESRPEVWDRALKGEPLGDVGFDGDYRFSGLHRIPYTVACVHEGSWLPDQLKVTVNVLDTGHLVRKSRLYQALLSHRTLGVDVPDLAHVPAALYALQNIDLESAGVSPPRLDVHWGSIVCFGALTMAREAGGDEWGHHPRKFCRSGYFPPYRVLGNTDHREYWIGLAMGEPAPIDLDKYKAAAKSQNREKVVIGKDAAGGYGVAADRTVVFRSVGKPESPEMTPVFYVEGSAQFESEGIDLGAGAIVVNGNAIFAGSGHSAPLQLHVPSRADREYPYLAPDKSFPCESQLGASCSSSEAMEDSGPVDFRGFLYVKGDLFIDEDTVLAGVVRVDGRLKIAQGKQLTIFFDDNVSHAILLKGVPILQQFISQPI